MPRHRQLPCCLALGLVMVCGLLATSAHGDDASPAALADAVAERDAAAIDRLLAQQAAVDARQADGMTALLWAVYQDDAKLAERLVAAGADVKAVNRYGISALSLACENGNGTIVKLLLAKGADPNAQRDGGETVLMTAARTGKLAAVQALIAAGANVNATERSGQTALMWAAAAGHAEVVDALIQARAEFDRPLRSGFTPLCFAARNGHIDVVRRLLLAGADVNRAMTKARGNGADPDANTSPLLLAIENGHFELAVVLLDAGANPNDDRTGYAPLHVLSWVRKPEHGDNERGAPPPRGSGKLTSLDFVRELVRRGADVNFPKQSGGPNRLRISTAGTTPFLCAAATADVDYLKLLLELGADPKAVNSLKQTALILAAGIDEKPEGDGPASPEEHYAAVVYLLGLDIYDVNATDKNGQTAMHGAAYKSLPAVVKLLDERGADVKIWSRPSKQGRTPLSIAQGFRPGNFKPNFETVDAISQVMRSHGIAPPPAPKEREQYEE